MKIPKSLYRTFSIVLVFIAGFFLPQMAKYSFLIRELIMFMLFLVFLQIKPSRNIMSYSHFILLLANLLIGPLGYLGVRSLGGSYDFAMAMFFAGITPTATAAPVIMGFLKGSTNYVLGGFLITNIGVGLLIPYILPFFVEDPVTGITLSIFYNILFVMGLPLLLAVILRLCFKKISNLSSKMSNFSFTLWLIALFLIASKAGLFLEKNEASWNLSWYLFGTLVMCMFNFGLGYFIVPRSLRREGSQVLGQKNTTLTIYLALVYGNPLIALGPICYVLWHNLWNAIQLSKINDKKVIEKD